MTDPVRRLKNYGRDLSTIPLSRLPTDLEKCCFICCNTYSSYRLNLGVGPINDAVSWAKCMERYHYKIYFLHNPHSRNFLKYLDHFFEKTTNHLVVYYVGHGSSVKDTNGDEADGYDEVMVFDNGYIVDDELAQYLNKYSRGTAHTILLSDCCHSGTIWDIPEKIDKAKKFPANIMSISAAEDSQTAKQMKQNNSTQGIFTFNFWTLIRSKPNITSPEIEKVLNKEMKQFKQQYVAYPTRRDMLQKPIFPLMINPR